MRRAQRETSAGGIVFRCGENGPHYLLILDGYGKWGFPKGHVDTGESAEAAARREVREEAGLDELILNRALGTIDWYFQLHGRVVHKFCHYFLFESPAGDPVPQREERIAECRWYSAEDAARAVSYDNLRGLLQQAVPVAQRRCQAGGPRS